MSIDKKISKLIVVKIGGKVLDDPEKLELALSEFTALPGYKILVHGGGKTADKILKSLNIRPKFVQGRRVTDASTLEIVQMVYKGLINQNIVAQLEAKGCHSIGFSGVDGNSILAKKRTGSDIDFGYAGDIEKVNSSFLNQILKLDITPVFCSLTHNGKGQILNTNADTIAAELSIALSVDYQVSLIYCFEKQGVLEDPEIPATCIDRIDLDYYNTLRGRNIIQNGMIPKMENAFHALKKGSHRVMITNYKSISKVLNRKRLGTEITIK